MYMQGVGELLQDAGLGTMGSTIFAHFMPTDKTGILLRDPFGSTRIDHELPGYRKTSFMLIVRDPSHAAARSKIEEAMAACTIHQETELSGWLVKYMRPRTEPFTYQPSPGALIEMSTNIDVAYVLL